MPSAAHRQSLRVALAYALGAAAWVAGSDWLLVQLAGGSTWFAPLAALKGWFFVAVTAALLYGGLRRTLAARPAPDATPPAALAPLWRWPLLWRLAVVVALTVAALAYEYGTKMDTAGAQIEAVAELRTRETEAWLNSQLAVAQFVRGSPLWAGLYAAWRDRRDTGARDQLLARAAELRQSFGAQAVWLLDHQGQRVAAEPAATGPLPEPLRLAAQRAQADGRPVHTGLYRDPSDPSAVWLDVLAPLTGTESPARAALVLHIDARPTLLATLDRWPLPSRSATTLLVQRVGDTLVGSQGRRPVPLSSPDNLVARAVRGEAPFGRAVRGLDVNGRGVIGATRPVAGTDWFLVARIERAEVLAPILHNAAWIVAAGLLGALGTVFNAVRSRDRRALELARQRQAEQQEQLRARALLQAIADASTDAIFAKDLQGRYLVCNREAARLMGRPAEQICGRDDRAIFPPEQAATLMANDAQVMHEGRVRTYEEVLDTADGAGVFLAIKGPLHDERGQVSGLFGISRDITRRKADEAALRDSEATTRTLLGAMADGMFVAQDHRFVFANAALPRMLGHDPDSFAGLTFAEVVAPPYLELWTTRYEQRMGSGPDPVNHYEVEFLCKGGERRVWVELRASRFVHRGRTAVLGLVSDITQRKRDERQLREASELVQAVEDSVLDHMAVLDASGRVVAVNAAWTDFAAGAGAGRPPPGTGVGSNYLQVCDTAAAAGDEGAAAAAAGIRGVLQRGQGLFQHEYPCNTPEGLRWFQMSVTPLRTEGGGAVVVHADVSQRRRAEDAVRESEGQYRSMVSALDEGILIFDTRLRLQACNAQAERFFGLSLAELKKEHSFARWQPQRADGTPMPLRELPASRTLHSGRPCRDQLLAVHAPQGLRWLMVNAEPVHDESTGTLTGVVTTFSDITERHAAEDQLRKLSLAVEQSPIAIAISDPEGRIEYVNDAFTRISGYTRDEALGQYHAVLQPHRGPLERRAEMRATLAAGHAWRGEFSSRRKNGEPYDELVHVAPIRQADGRITHALAIGEDITERKRMQAELDEHRHRLEHLVDERTQQLQRVNTELVLSRDRAEAANRAKSAFLANMSHEIRTPMNAIIGLTHLLQRSQVDATQRSRLDRIGDAASHLLQVINDILDLSKIEAGKLELEELDFSLSDLLQRATTLVAEAARHKGLSLQVHADGVPELLRGDPTRVSQALVNLLSNAVKFTERGRVDVHVERLPDDGDGLQLRFCVVDTGIGIEPHVMEHLFSAFVQADASTTRRFGGTGLGLAITQRLAAMMGGSVGLDSRPGQGSSFWFSVRLQPGRAATGGWAPDSDAEDELRRRCAGARVLLVEDNPVNQEVARELMQSVGLQVQVADNGLQAIEAAMQGRYDLVLMDVQMPVMDGLQATRQLRSLPGLRELPVLAMTAHAFGEDRQACLDAGMNDHVVKPIDLRQLYAALLRWLPQAGPAAPPAPVPAPPAAATPLHIDGLDTAVALKNLRGRVDTYRRVLAQFADHYGTLRAELARLPDSDDTAWVRQSAHGLKGSSAAIGAFGLMRRAEQLEVAAGVPGIAADAARALLAELDSVLHQVRSFVATPPGDSTEAAGPALSSAEVQRLRAMLERGDFDAITQVQRLTGKLRRRHADAAREIEAAVSAFDFERALAVLGALPAGA